MNNKQQKIFLHICCASCSIEVIDSLVENGFEIYGYFYNPNIQPFDEYLKRRDSVIQYLDKLGFKYEIPEYDTYEYFEKIGNNLKGEDRCSLCYDLRLKQSAERAKELGFSEYSSTLLWNPYKDFDNIAEVGRRNAEKYGLEFVFPTLTHDYRKYINKAREESFYLQKYCGCVFSSWENRKIQGSSKAVKQ